MSRTMDVLVAENGRLVLPKAAREAMGLARGGKVILTLEDGEARLTPMRHGVRRAQDLYRRHASAPRATADFLNDRKAEADAEEGAADDRLEDS